jgi:ATP diphosphatase
VTEPVDDAPRYSLQDLLRIMQRLRDPENGCPWDRQQDFRSILPSTLEECYELAAAIETEDWPQVSDELGDLLFQVVFYAQLGREQGRFDFPDVVHGLAGKLLRRHPHVFAGGEIEGVVEGALDAAAVKQQWEDMKAGERTRRSQHGVLADVPLALPALPRAQKLQKRAARVGFDWTDAREVLQKLDEERAELEVAMAGGESAAIEAELGDLLFTTVNLARHLRVDAEAALRGASQRFETRFADKEQQHQPSGGRLEDCDSATLEHLWQRAKARELSSED